MEDDPGVDAGRSRASGSSGSSQRLRESSLKSDERRNKLIAELRRKIKNENKRRSDSSSGEEEPQNKRKTKSSKSMRGNKYAGKESRTVELGWIHNSQQVRKQTGGGTRKINVAKTAVASDLTEQATNLFFPGGVSKRGIKLDDVNVSLCDFSMTDSPIMQSVGETYEKVKPSGILRWYLSTTMKSFDTESNVTSMTETQKSVQLKGKAATPNAKATGKPSVSTKELDSVWINSEPPSLEMDTVQYSNAPVTSEKYRSVTTKERATSPHACVSQKEGLYPVIQGEVCISQRLLRVDYSKDVESQFCDKISTLTASSRSACVYVDPSEESCSLEDNVGDPLESGYKVSRISQDDKVFVTPKHASCEGQESQYEFPSLAAADNADPYLMIHHPDELWGYEEGRLILGVVSHHHNNDGISYEWYRDGEPVYSGGSVIKVDKPGQYHCTMKAFLEVEGELKHISRESNKLQVVRLSQDVRSDVTLSSPRKKSNSNCEDLVPDSGISKQTPCVNVQEMTKGSNCQQIDATDVSCDYKNPINHGSYGEVYKGTMQGASVAVKKIRMMKGKRPDRLILREAAIHQRISHNNIVKFMGTYMDVHHVYIITEFVEGLNMHEMIYLGTDPVDKATKISVAVGVLEGVSYLHDQDPQIIHQDLKPENILLDTSLSPKLCDLGLAKTRSYGVASTSSISHAVGTIEYMAPELFLQQGRSSASSDVWSIGLTLVEWFTGKDPWDMENQEEEPHVFIRECMQKKDIPPGARGQTLSLLHPCLSYSPVSRPTAVHLLNRFKCPTCPEVLG
ncbi:uncharacterized protein LOC121408186 [Lytechinus variegatus]|uniref:uncharacterized protein LOC121408186 n=1 Tax=Lytechinus variegatus TaxID=7654 RepID=UPI001BB0F995|nr:uncharacterized protein LOC121408186 [Lytechinus variegatus]